MIAITSLEHARPRERRLAAGFFDGIHLGHQQTIRGCDTVLTFDPHPRAILGRGEAPKQLSTLAHRAELLESLGVVELVVIDFDRARSLQSPESFVQEVLVDRLRVSELHVGSSFRYGHRAAGTPATLTADGRFTVLVADTVEVDGLAVSSTRVRELISAGNIGQASRLLGSAPCLEALVVQRPTADAPETALALSPTACLPPPGDYPCLANGVPDIVTITKSDQGPPQQAVGTLSRTLGGAAGSHVRLDLTANATQMTDLQSSLAGPARPGVARSIS